MANEPSSRRFTTEEVNAILRRALERQGSSSTGAISYSDLVETARELGIDPEQIEAVISEEEEVGQMENARERWKVQRKKKFYEHLRSYVIVNLMLFMLDFFVSDGTWFFWVLFGWGFGILFDASDTFFPKERDIERGARRMLEREARQRRREMRETGRSNSREFRIGHGDKSVTIDGKAGRIVIEKGGKRIEIG